MASSQRAITTTSSRSSLGTARGGHAFEISGYSQHKGLGIGESVRSATFTVGSCEWSIVFYPDGEMYEHQEYVSVFLELLTLEADVRAGFDMSLVVPSDPATTKLIHRVAPMFFGHIQPDWGLPKFMKRAVLESSPYLEDDRLVIKCEVTVVRQPQVEETSPDFEVQVPPSDLYDNLGKLLESGEEADVIFKVKRESFSAHKIVLAMRSPVFKVELYGPMSDKRTGRITVKDMQPAVFKALLQFIYTDSLPSMLDLCDNDQKEMVKHLLVAADKYAMERLKLICEGILCRSLDVDSVATTLALADQHHCGNLKNACVQFILTANRMDAVLASKGYTHLKRSCPSVIVDIFERATKSRKIL
ncbi:BTB/POZ and MATH domain-containing protein 1-like [Aegilops tauschii subsp. strangulata]|nr:BTB/POZ and MATH domain-containing protein 1-like [Aegilops tauschii subsp. strangulata]XP_044353613.1 BTB/POZ and MATH domain-containing protein 1-like [Triticum aestivum]